MLRSGNSIRLTPSEKETFGSMAVDSSKAPTTVQEHDSRLDLAATTWAQGGSADELLMAELAKAMKIEGGPDTSELALVLSPLESLRNDVSAMWEIDASAMALPEMLKLAEDAVAEYRNDELPEASKVFEELAQEIRGLMTTEPLPE